MHSGICLFSCLIAPSAKAQDFSYCLINHYCSAGGELHSGISMPEVKYKAGSSTSIFGSSVGDRKMSFTSLHSLASSFRRFVVSSCPTLRDPMDQSTTGPPVFRCFRELFQIHSGSFDDIVQPSHPLLSPSPLAFTLS